MKSFHFLKGKMVPRISVKKIPVLALNKLSNIQESPRSFCHRYTMRNALGLENLGPFLDNTKLIVAGLIFTPLKYLGFV